MCRTFHSSQNSTQLYATNCRPLSVYRTSGTPCTLNSAFRVSWVVWLLQSQGRHLTNGNFEKGSATSRYSFPMRSKKSALIVCHACLPHILQFIIDAIPKHTPLGSQLTFVTALVTCVQGIKNILLHGSRYMSICSLPLRMIPSSIDDSSQ